jgi:muramoyltetrapeptide carboxypeptidase
VVPQRLRSGDRVAVVAPSGRVEAERLEIGVEHLKGWGLDVELMPSVLTQHERLPYLPAEDDVRASELRSAWLDPQYTAVFSARGGFGVQRMVDLVDLDELVAAPKWFVGFSDVSALHEPLNARGLVTLLGPVASGVEQLGDPDGRERLRALLFEPESVKDLLAPRGGRTLVEGVAEGRLGGGNLALLASSVGTPTHVQPDGVVVLEDTNEYPYRVDRLLTQLLRSGWFDRVTGVVLGDFGLRGDQIGAVLRERLVPLGVPMVEGVAVGHETPNLAVPLGLPVRLDATATTLTPLFP